MRAKTRRNSLPLRQGLLLDLLEFLDLLFRSLFSLEVAIDGSLVIPPVVQGLLPGGAAGKENDRQRCECAQSH